jgi:HSP90 family molecular chaperone
MTAADLRNWATMGVSQSDTSDKISLDSTSYSDRGYISRFGVGAKRAAFYLGKKIQINSRSNHYILCVFLYLKRMERLGSIL